MTRADRDRRRYRSSSPSRADRDRAIAAKVTLDGRPAKIIGAKNDFATVASLDGKLTAEWSWQTAIHIADSHRRFAL